MNADDRAEGLLEDLEKTLQAAAELVARGRIAFDDDIAIRLAFEALSNRLGEVAKQLTQLDSQRFSEPVWSFAAKNRDKIVHHYNIIDLDVLWETVATDFPQIGELARTKRAL
ncbi:MAG: hypothetical protein JWR04_2588 [Rhodoglobus sp.]|jgi:uncharacterized protein with HEPN domain|nr:hypothetical protein [Rhodoglobus sp.]